MQAMTPRMRRAMPRDPHLNKAVMAALPNKVATADLLSKVAMDSSKVVMEVPLNRVVTVVLLNRAATAVRHSRVAMVNSKVVTEALHPAKAKASMANLLKAVPAVIPASSRVVMVVVLLPHRGTNCCAILAGGKANMFCPTLCVSVLVCAVRPLVHL